MTHLTGNGRIRIERRICWYPGEGTDNRVDRWLGIADASLSVIARELCCLTGVEKAGGDVALQRLDAAKAALTAVAGKLAGAIAPEAIGEVAGRL